jgi:5'-nucleotidase
MLLKSSDNRPIHILITNDDGIHANGIKFLWQALKSHAHLTVVAPSGEQSAVGLSTTLRHPLRVEKIHWGPDCENIWSVSGTPADCIKMGLHAILDKRPDLVVSGINRGSNLGRNVLYSGTVAAAIESTMQGIPAIALSCQDYHIEPDYQSAGNYVPTIVQYIMNHPLPEGTLLNVNFPEKSLGKFKGFKMTGQGDDLWIENPDKRMHPAERHSYYWLGSQLKRGKEIEESDDKWIRKGYITAVPVHVGNLTDREHLEIAKSHFENSFPQVF